jgi:hypothetical protein
VRSMRSPSRARVGRLPVAFTDPLDEPRRIHNSHNDTTKGD